MAATRVGRQQARCAQEVVAAMGRSCKSGVEPSVSKAYNFSTN